MSRFFSRPRITAGVLAAAAATFACIATIEVASAHKSSARVQIRFVPSANPDAAREYEIHVRSRVRACYRRVPVRLVRDGRIIFANRTNADGVVISPRDDKVRTFGEEFAGARVLVRHRTITRRSGHRHGCAGASRVFQPFE